MSQDSLGAVLSQEPHWDLPERKQAARPPGGMTQLDQERVWRAGYVAGFGWSKPSWDNPYREGTVWAAAWAEGYEAGRKKGAE